MKKYLLSIAALLLGLLAHSQEADDLGNYAEVSIIPRLDLNPSWTSNPKTSGFDLGNSSLYTLFEGSASEHFSWTVANHWFAAGNWFTPEMDAWEMFKGLGYSDTTNWIDFLKADLTFGSWTFTLGKDCITTGGHEYEEWDWEVHPLMASPIWNDLAPYQWGGKVAWTTPSEMSVFSLQMTTSPFGEHPFSSGLWTYSFQWSGAYGWFSPMWSVSAFGIDKGQYNWLISLGNQILLEDWTFTLDWSNTSGIDEEYTSFMPGHTFHGRIDYAPSDRWDVSLRGNYIYSNSTGYLDTPMRAYNIGAAFEFYPLRDSQDLRLHAVAHYDAFSSAFSLSFGVLYNLRITLW